MRLTKFDFENAVCLRRLRANQNGANETSKNILFQNPRGLFGCQDKEECYPVNITS